MFKSELKGLGNVIMLSLLISSTVFLVFKSADETLEQQLYCSKNNFLLDSAAQLFEAQLHFSSLY